MRENSAEKGDSETHKKEATKYARNFRVPPLAYGVRSDGTERMQWAVDHLDSPGHKACIRLKKWKKVRKTNRMIIPGIAQMSKKFFQ